MIYTSYFAKLKQIRAAGIVPVSIARYTPRWAGQIKRMPELAPSENILTEYKQTGDAERYTARYKAEILGNQNPVVVGLILQAISDGKDVALLCYEKSGDFCHRHLMAEWLRENGVACEEWKAK